METRGLCSVRNSNRSYNIAEQATRNGEVNSQITSSFVCVVQMGALVDDVVVMAGEIGRHWQTHKLFS